ncbi:hypothetical protein R3P38DRAFT_2773321 [Favolaschia claudopus]|uniref:Uncharacterized protein n=1 Tax=Favolaschia claudopus TaxID=2862362 RepID=A0AAW0C0V3_9AGAR
MATKASMLVAAAAGNRSGAWRSMSSAVRDVLGGGRTSGGGQESVAHALGLLHVGCYKKDAPSWEAEEVNMPSQVALPSAGQARNRHKVKGFTEKGRFFQGALSRWMIDVARSDEEGGEHGGYRMSSRLQAVGCVPRCCVGKFGERDSNSNEDV